MESFLHVVLEVQVHDHEQEQHHDRAGVDDDLHHPDELGAEQQVEAGQRAEREHEEQGTRHRIAVQDDHQARADQDGREHREQRRDHDRPPK
jgi:hypothetical protein